MFSRSSLPPPPKLPFPRRRPTASISSMKTMEGAWERACAISGCDAPAATTPPRLVVGATLLADVLSATVCQGSDKWILKVTSYMMKSRK